MQNYLAHTQSIASSLSHAWDISSLLIKPVQRLLKYPLLLAAIIDETPDTHPDKAYLREARKQMEEAARNVNEGRRRAEVVRDVLSASKKKQVTKIKSLRPPPPQAHEEAVLVHRLQNELYDMDEFARKFATDVVEWVAAINNVARHFRAWAVGFGNVLGLTEEQPSEAFNAFLNVIENYLLALCADLDATINERFMKELTLLLSTMITPMKLLQSMNERAPYHYHLLNVNISSKNRPPPSLLAASTNYLALRGQLAAELPTYVTLLHQGLLVFVRRLTTIQTEFWSKVRDQWLLLWEMLRLEEELNVTNEETSNVWFARWVEVDGFVASLPIMRSVNPSSSRKVRSISREGARARERELEIDDPEADAEFYAHHHLQAFAVPAPEYTPQDQRHSQNPPPSYTSNSPPSSTNRSSTTSDSPHTPYSTSLFASSLSGGYFNGLGGMGYERAERGGVAVDRGRDREREKDKKKKSIAQALNTVSMLSALEPSAVISPPAPLSPKSNSMTKSRTSSDLSSGGKKSITNRESNESLSSKATAKSPKHQPPHSPRQLPQHVQSTTANSRLLAHTQRRKTMSAVEPAPEDLKEYEMMMVKEQEKMRERERERDFGGYAGRGGNTDGHVYYQQHMAKFGGIPRTKSMPLPYHPVEGQAYEQYEQARRGAGEWSGFADEDDSDLFYHVAADPNEEYGREEESSATIRDIRDREKSPSHKERSGGKGRDDEKMRLSGNGGRSNISRGQSAERYTKDKEKPSSRTRSGSVKSITSFFTSSNHHKRGSHGDIGTSHTSQLRSPRDSWALKPAKYMCQVIHPCKPPVTGSTPLSYFSFPFFTLREEELYDVLQEAGHPSLHPNLPLKVEEGEEDCLLLCRAYDGSVGWALASFLEPIEM
jgi:hypothetical protein